MASEIRVNKIENRSGLGTVTFADTGVDLAGIVTATTFSGSGASLTNVPDSALSAVTSSKLTGALPALDGSALTGVASTENIRTNTNATFLQNVNVSGITTVGSAVTISESGIEASGIGITVANINGGAISGRRNMIINGDQRIAQRGTDGGTVTSSAKVRCVDRFKSDIDGSGGGDWSHEQSTDVPTGQGFTHSSKITTVTQASQPSGTSAKNQFYYMLEKQDVTHLEWGTSAAKTCTLSFWVKSSITGSYPLIFYIYTPSTQYYYTNYTISSANTWEKKVITLTGPTSGGVVSGTTATGWRVEFGLGYGSGFETGTLNEWTTSDVFRTAAGSVYLPENSGATWYLTGVQYEVGSQASAYEHRSYAEELALCQRYYYKHVDGNNQDIGVGMMYNTSLCAFSVKFPVSMRAAPSLDYVSSSDAYTIYRNGASDAFTSMGIVRAHTNTAAIDTSTGTSGNEGVGTILATATSSGYIAFASEL